MSRVRTVPLVGRPPGGAVRAYRDFYSLSPFLYELRVQAVITGFLRPEVRTGYQFGKSISERGWRGLINHPGGWNDLVADKNARGWLYPWLALAEWTAAGATRDTMARTLGRWLEEGRSYFRRLSPEEQERLRVAFAHRRQLDGQGRRVLADAINSHLMRCVGFPHTPKQRAPRTSLSETLTVP